MLKTSTQIPQAARTTHSAAYGRLAIAILGLAVATPARQLRAKRLARAAIVGAALMVGTAVSAAAAPAPATPGPVSSSPLPACVSIPGGTTVVALVSDAAGQLSLPCTPQAGQQLVVLAGATATSPNALGPTAQATSSPTPAQRGDDNLGTTIDPRVDTYAKRQAIRDMYRGQINETTFNDELGDGVGLAQALADAMAELGKTH